MIKIYAVVMVSIIHQNIDKNIMYYLIQFDYIL
jgi:hypothetical protein